MATDRAGVFLQPGEIRELADSLGVVPSKSRGQNFVVDANTVRKIVAQAGLTTGQTVVEVGPGLGSLTVALLNAGHPVHAIEIDSRMAKALESTVTRKLPGAPLEVVCADAMKVLSLPEKATAVVANLPYNVAVPILIHFLTIQPNLARVLVMVQAEVGWRLAARPGSEHYGAPSVKVAWWGEWALEGSISRSVFWPKPRVDSVLVGMRHRRPPGEEQLRHKVFQLVDEGFRTRRKMARQSLAALFGGAAEASKALSKVGIDPESRCETWSLADFVAVAQGERQER